MLRPVLAVVAALLVAPTLAGARGITVKKRISRDHARAIAFPRRTSDHTTPGGNSQRVTEFGQTEASSARYSLVRQRFHVRSASGARYLSAKKDSQFYTG